MTKSMFPLILISTFSPACADKEEDYSSVSSEALMERQAEIDAELAMRDAKDDASNNEMVLNGEESVTQTAPGGPPNMTWL